MKKYLYIGLCLFFMGCINPYAKYYYDVARGIDITRVESTSTDEPKIFRGNAIETDNQTMLENGYSPLGYSSFNAGNVSENQAVIQAKDVHASVVIVYSKYTNTVSGLLPLTLPTTQTSTTSLSGSVYGSGGSANYYGNAYTTTQGSRTTYIPYNVNRSDYFATYWVKMKTPIFGVQVRELTPELRKQINSNKGLVIIAVIKNSPAFMADLFKGDILKKIGDVEIIDYNSFKQAGSKYTGKKVDVVILRDNQEIIKEITFNEKP